MFKKQQLLILLILLSSLVGYSQTQVTPQWKSASGGLLQYFYPGKSPLGFDTLWNAQTIRSYLNGSITIGGDKIWTGNHTWHITGDDRTMSINESGWGITSTENSNFYGANPSDGIFAIALDKSSALFPYDLVYNKNTFTLHVTGPDNIVGSSKTQNFQDKEGTIALLSDVTGVDSTTIANTYATKAHVDSLAALNRNNSALTQEKIRAGTSIKITMAGTSLTYAQQAVGGPTPPTNGSSFTRSLYQPYTALNQTLTLAGISNTVVNDGHPGDKASDGKARIDTLPTSDVTILEYATNDNSNNINVDVFRQNMVYMIEKRISQGSYVILTISPDLNSSATNLTLTRYREVVRELAGIYNCDIIDLPQIMNWIGNIWEVGDQIHLNKEAYNEWGSQAAAIFIKPTNPIVPSGKSFNAIRRDIINAASVTNANSTTGNVWSMTASTSYPIVVDMRGEANISTKAISASGSRTYYVSYGNGINQKIDTASAATTSPVYRNHNIKLYNGKRILFISAGASAVLLDQLNFENIQGIVQVSDKLTVGGVNASFPDFNAITGPIMTERNIAGLGGPSIFGFKSQGTKTAPTAALANSVGVSIESFFYNGTSYHQGAAVRPITTEDQTLTNEGTRIAFLTTQSGSTTMAERMSYTDYGGLQLHGGPAGASAGYTTPGLIAIKDNSTYGGVTFHLPDGTYGGGIKRISGALEYNYAGGAHVFKVSNVEYARFSSLGLKTTTGVLTTVAAGVAGTDSLLSKSATTNIIGKIAANYYATNPMTTLGDVIYGGASGVTTRLAGNTTTARKFLSSLGNGTISAAPTYFDIFNTFNTWTSQNISNGNLSLTQTSPGSNGALFFDDGSGFTIGLQPENVTRTFTSTYIFRNLGTTSHGGNVAITEEIGVINTTTVVLSSATLNSTYPQAIPGYKVICSSIIAGPIIYIKGSGTTWLVVPATIAP